MSEINRPSDLYDLRGRFVHGYNADPENIKEGSPHHVRLWLLAAFGGNFRGGCYTANGGPRESSLRSATSSRSRTSIEIGEVGAHAKEGIPRDG
jgi:hypothetical protein